MRVAGVALACVVGGLTLVGLLCWVTWTYVLTDMGKVMVLMFFGIGSLGGQ